MSAGLQYGGKQRLCYIPGLGGQPFKIVFRGGLAWIEALRLSKVPWLVHAFSTRQGGRSHSPCAGLNLGSSGWDRRELVELNRRRSLRQLDAADFVLASLRQIHSSHAYMLARDGAGQLCYQPSGVALTEQAPTSPPAGDGLLTAEAGILLTVRIADCLPVLLVDAHRRVVAAVHAGWRGALARVIEKAVGDMHRVFGSHPGQLMAALGPSIRACCYEVGEEVVEAFHGQFVRADQFFRTPPHRPEAATQRRSIPFLGAYPPGHAPQQGPAAHLDLVAVALDQLARAGVKLSNALIADYCTACRTDLFFSHRKEGERTGRQMAVVGIRPGKRGSPTNTNPQASPLGRGCPRYEGR
ncbi:MAG: peptidoglycan editing factor PgeF [Acidobacteriia bacterium]|nr:peptidoglycan editing factor PgeF [Terriglobia bacterium]